MIKLNNRKYLIRKFQKVLFLFVSMLLLGSSFNYANLILPFTDIKEGQWFYDRLKYAYEFNIINGFEDNTFRPQQTLTREQYIKILVMLIDSKFEPTKYQGDTWFTPYLRFANKYGIVKIVNMKEDYWKQPITRGDVALYTYRALNISRKPERIEFEKNDMSAEVHNKMPDYLSMDIELQEAVRVLFTIGIINGYEDGTYRPANILTRAEVTSLIQKFHQNRILDIFKEYVVKPENY